MIASYEDAASEGIQIFGNQIENPYQDCVLTEESNGIVVTHNTCVATDDSPHQGAHRRGVTLAEGPRLPGVEVHLRPVIAHNTLSGWEASVMGQGEGVEEACVAFNDLARPAPNFGLAQVNGTWDLLGNDWSGARLAPVCSGGSCPPLQPAITEPCLDGFGTQEPPTEFGARVQGDGTVQFAWRYPEVTQLDHHGFIIEMMEAQDRGYTVVAHRPANDSKWTWNSSNPWIDTFDPLAHHTADPLPPGTYHFRIRAVGGPWEGPTTVIGPVVVP